MNFSITEDKVQDFELHLQEQEKAPATIDKYVSNVRKFMTWLDGEEITHARILEYREYLCLDHAPQTVNGILAGIDSFLGYMGRQDLQVKHLKVQQKAFREPDREMTRAEYDLLVATAKEQGKDRLALILETICSTGIRVSELHYITVEAVAAKKAVVSLKGKIRTIFMTKDLLAKLRAYARENNITSGEIFLTRTGRPLSRKQIWAEMKALCAAAGIAPSKVFPHNLRHLFAQLYYETKKDIVKLADVMGHSRIETTRIYLASSGEEHLQILESMKLVSRASQEGIKK